MIDGIAPQAQIRRFLMCRPDHFDVAFEINPWMSMARRPDPDLARAQWTALVAALVSTGATVYQEDGVEGLPDLVFAADAAVVDGDRFVTAAFRWGQRRGEMEYTRDRLIQLGLHSIGSAPDGSFLEGGDVVAFGDLLVVGYGHRTSLSALDWLADAYQATVVGVRLRDERFYHLDMSFCPLDERRAIVAPDAWDEESARTILQLVPEPLIIDLDEAATFCANSVVVGATVLMSDCPPRVERQLAAWGFAVGLVRIDEFLKAGGGIRCLTLDLDLRGGRS